MKKTCILVLGMHRSGTSAISGVLSSYGIDFGSNLLPAAKDNQKGFFEDQDIVALNNKILRENDSSWDDSRQLEVRIRNRERAISDIKKIICIRNKNINFCFKDPRISILFPLYEEALTELNVRIKVVYIFRNPNEVATSLYKRDGFDETKSKLLWIKYNYFAEKYSRSHDRIVISYRNLVYDYETVSSQIKSWLNLSSVLEEKFIDPNLIHNRHDESLSDESFCGIVYKSLQVLSGGNQSTSIENISSCIAFFYERLCIAQDKINDLVSNLVEVKNNNAVLVSELDIHKRTLDEIYKSRAWKTISLYRKLRGNIQNKSLSTNISHKNKAFPLPDTLITKHIEGKPEGRNICIFAHYSEKPLVDKYVFYYLSKIREQGFSILFISTARDLDKSSIQSLSSVCSIIVTRKNLGYDFGSWCEGIRILKDNKIVVEKLLLANDSVYGPLFDIGQVIKTFESSGVDFYGMTDSYEIDYHLQSYFLLFNNKVLSSEPWNSFWCNYHVQPDKASIIREYEVGLSQLLLNRGFKAGVLIKSHDAAHDAILAKHPYSSYLTSNRSYNITHLLWDFIITNYNFPFVKKELISVNPLKISTMKRLTHVISNTEYDLNLIQETL